MQSEPILNYLNLMMLEFYYLNFLSTLVLWVNS